MAPNTPKAGSSLVSRVIGVAEADAEALALDAAADDDADEEVGVAVYVTLKVVGTTVVYWEFWPLVVVEVVIVLELVVSEREREAEDAEDGADDDDPDDDDRDVEAEVWVELEDVELLLSPWATTATAMKAAPSRAVTGHRIVVRGKRENER